MSLVEECAVCAGPLEWTAFGPCGHKEACSHCVARLRFVMSDKRCVICQQESPQASRRPRFISYFLLLPAFILAGGRIMDMALPALRHSGIIFRLLFTAATYAQWPP